VKHPHPLRLSLVALALASAFGAHAQTTDTERLKALQQQLDKSLAMMEQLTRRLAALEQQRPSPAPASAPEVGARVETLERTVADLAGSSAHASADTGVPLHGFLDVGYAHLGRNDANTGKPGFRLGTFDMYLTPQFSDRVKGLVELAFEYNSEGSLGTDLERLQLGYVVNDDLTLWAGRFHTPYGYWNTAFHHGAQIQTSITRPRLIAFEDQGGILPAHSVGLWGTGKLDTRLGALHYDAYLGNADSLRGGTLDYNASGYDHAALGSGFNLGLQPTALPGLTVGAHGLQQLVNSYDSSNTLNGKVKLQALGGYAFYESDRAEVIGEFYSFNNSDRYGEAGRNRSSAGFVQGAYQLINQWTGFARYERASLNEADPYFKLMNTASTQFGSSYVQHTLGLRYDLDPRSALKVQAERIRQSDLAAVTTNALRVQYSVRF